MSKRELFLIIVLLFLLPPISAELMISKTDSLYNIGDDFSITITATPSIQTKDFLILTLVCPNSEIEIYKNPLSLNANQKKEISVSSTFDNFLIGDTEGVCSFKAEYGNDEAESYKFELTKNIDVTIEVSGIVFEPDETVKVSGKAAKSNTKPFTGFVEIEIPDIGVSTTEQIQNGSFSAAFTLPSDAPAGLFKIQATAYEKDIYGELTNQGVAESMLRIKQVIKEFELALNYNSIPPETELLYTIIVSDQAGQEVAEDAAVTIFKPDNSVLEKKLVKSNTANSLFIASNFTPEYWEITASLNDLEVSKSFLVEELERISYSLENNVLTVTNTGNVRYKKIVEISIGDSKEIKDLDIPVGKEKKFTLSAPDGDYEISIGDGSQGNSLGSVFLTGKAVSVSDPNKFSLPSNSGYYIWIAVILVLFVAAALFIRRIVKNKSFLKRNKPSEIPVKSKSPESVLSSSVIEHGKKQEATVIALRINNLHALNKSALSALDSALWKAKETGAKIYTDKEYRIIIFSQALSKHLDYNLKAVTTAQTLARILSQYNHTAAQKIDFGIGINTGDLIIESGDSKINFISVENTVSIAKKLSHASKGEILLSEFTHRKTSEKVKTEKVSGNIFKIKRIIDRSEHSEFINRFMTKQKFEKNRR